MEYVRNWSKKRRVNLLVYFTIFIFSLGLLATSSIVWFNKPVVSPYQSISAEETIIKTSNFTEDDLNNDKNGLILDKNTLRLDYSILNINEISVFNSYLESKSYSEAIKLINKWTITDKDIKDEIFDNYNAAFDFNNQEGLSNSTESFDLVIKENGSENILLSYRFNNVNYSKPTNIIDGPSKETIDDIVTNNEAVKIDVYLNKDNSKWNTITTESNWTKENQELVNSLNEVLSTSKDDTKWSFDSNRFKLLDVAFVSFSSNLLKFKINLEDSKVLDFELTRKDLDIGNIVDTSEIKEEDLNDPDTGITYKDNVISMDYRIDDISDISNFNSNVSSSAYSKAIKLINNWKASSKKIKENIADNFNVEFVFGKDNEDKVLKVDSLYFELRIKDKTNDQLILTYRFNNTYIPVENIIDGPSKETIDEIIKNNETVKIDVYLSEDNSKWNTITTESNWTKENQELVKSLNTVLSTSKDYTKWSFDSNRFKLLDVAFVSFSSNLLKFQINLEDSKVLNFELTRKDLDIGNIVDTSEIKEEDLNDPDTGITYKDNVISMDYRIDDISDISNFNSNVSSSAYSKAIKLINNWTASSKNIKENIADNFNVEFVFGKDNEDKVLKVDSLYFELRIKDKTNDQLILTYRFNNTYIPVENIIDGPSKETIDEIIKNNETVKIDVYLSEDNSKWNTITTESNWTKENQELVKSLNTVLSTSKDYTKWSFDSNRFKLLDVAFVSFSSNLLKFQINLEDSKVLNFELTRKDLDIGNIVDTSEIKEEDLNDPDTGITYKDNVISMDYRIDDISDISNFNSNVSSSAYSKAIKLINNWKASSKKIKENIADNFNVEFVFGKDNEDKVLKVDSLYFELKVIDKATKTLLLTYRFNNIVLSEVSSLFNKTFTSIRIYQPDYNKFFGTNAETWEAALVSLINNGDSDDSKKTIINIFKKNDQSPIIKNLSYIETQKTLNKTTIVYVYKVGLIERKLTLEIDQTYKAISEFFPTLSSEIKNDLLQDKIKNDYKLEIIANKTLNSTELESIFETSNWSNQNFDKKIKDLLNKIYTSDSVGKIYFNSIPEIKSGDNTINDIKYNGYNISFNSIEYKGLRVNVSISVLPTLEVVKDETSDFNGSSSDISFDNDSKTYTINYSINQESEINSFNNNLSSRDLQSLINNINNWMPDSSNNKIIYNSNFDYNLSLSSLTKDTDSFNIEISKKSDSFVLLTYRFLNIDKSIIESLFKQDTLSFSVYDDIYGTSFVNIKDDPYQLLQDFLNNQQTDNKQKAKFLELLKNPSSSPSVDKLSSLTITDDYYERTISYIYKQGLLEKKLSITVDTSYNAIIDFFPTIKSEAKEDLTNGLSTLKTYNIEAVVDTSLVSDVEYLKNQLSTESNWKYENFDSTIKGLINNLSKDSTGKPLTLVNNFPNIPVDHISLNISGSSVEFIIEYDNIKVQLKILFSLGLEEIKEETSKFDTNNEDISFNKTENTYYIKYTISNTADIDNFNKYLSEGKIEEVISTINKWIPDSSHNRLIYSTKIKYDFGNINGNTNKLLVNTKDFSISIRNINEDNKTKATLIYNMVNKSVLVLSKLGFTNLSNLRKTDNYLVSKALDQGFEEKEYKYIIELHNRWDTYKGSDLYINTFKKYLSKLGLNGDSFEVDYYDPGIVTQIVNNRWHIKIESNYGISGSSLKAHFSLSFDATPLFISELFIKENKEDRKKTIHNLDDDAKRRGPNDTTVDAPYGNQFRTERYLTFTYLEKWLNNSYTIEDLTSTYSKYNETATELNDRIKENAPDGLNQNLLPVISDSSIWYSIFNNKDAITFNLKILSGKQYCFRIYYEYDPGKKAEYQIFLLGRTSFTDAP